MGYYFEEILSSIEDIEILKDPLPYYRGIKAWIDCRSALVSLKTSL